jgi:methyl-accepting chemotaxis protein
MKSLAHLKLKHKLSILVGIPVGFLFFQSSHEAARNLGAIAKAGVNLELAHLSEKLGAAVHETQKERGLSALHLGAAGDARHERLVAQRAETDRRVTELQAFVSAMKADVYGEDFGRQLAGLREQLGALAGIREGVSRKSLPAAEAIGFFARLNSAAIDLEVWSGRLAADADLARISSAHLALKRLKEKSSIERALLGSAAAGGKFAPGMYERFVRMVAEQDMLEQAFFAAASRASIDLYRARLSGEAINAAHDMRRAAFTGAGGEGMDAARWFAVQTAKIERLKEIEDHIAAEAIAHAEGLADGSRSGLIVAGVFLLIALGTSLGLGIYIVRRVTGSVLRARDAAARIAAGDLAADIDDTGSDEVGQLLRSMSEMSAQLHRILTEINEGAGMIETAAREISAGNSELSVRTQEQASALEETAASMEQMTGSVKHNAENAQATIEAANAAKTQAHDGALVATNAIGAMDSIRDHSQKIAGIISVIDEIAFQTNLLALNAAVEAARAGEHGRGFAVVATEVRNLAQRSAGAAREIKALINETGERVKEGSDMVDQSGETLAMIVGSAAAVSNKVAEITNASHEQAQGIEQVNKALMQLDSTTQQNAALVEEVAAASKSLEDQAKHLFELIAFFRLTGAPGAAGPESEGTPGRSDRPVMQLVHGGRQGVRERTPASGGDDALSPRHGRHAG